MSDVSGAGPVDPGKHKTYAQEYKQGADLFQRALDQYEKSDNPNQKAQFKDVMDKALNILNESAHGMMRKEVEKQNEQIRHDYETFQKSPKDPDAIKKLNQDLNDAKKTID